MGAIHILNRIVHFDVNMPKRISWGFLPNFMEDVLPLGYYIMNGLFT